MEEAIRTCCYRASRSAMPQSIESPYWRYIPFLGLQRGLLCEFQLEMSPTALLLEAILPFTNDQCRS